MNHIAPTLTGLIVALALAGTATAAEIIVTLDGVEARGGTLYVALQTEDQFMKEEGIAATLKEAPDAGSHTFTFDVPAGQYSLSVWHDDNGNGEFDRMESGQPLDGWAMINGTELRSFPTFAAVSIDVTDTGASISEPITYGR